MKRRDLLKYLTKYGCYLLREGGNHSVWCNPSSNRVSTVPRHTEINDYLAKKICKDLEIPIP
ncbi:MAG: type II toxin-antitoxin system HicA family toxin [Ignavibacteria bacterium]|nr:type II toxin-antitoxin system HicA family toxin [Ignavibacteria bacterium]